jgi:hypothetical protein
MLAADLSTTLSTRTLLAIRSCLNRAVKRAMARDGVRRNVVELTELPTGQGVGLRSFGRCAGTTSTLRAGRRQCCRPPRTSRYGARCVRRVIPSATLKANACATQSVHRRTPGTARPTGCRSAARRALVEGVGTCVHNGSGHSDGSSERPP